MRSIKQLMIGTAGHVDHGKTSLVRHLTGFDTDRHKEEQVRGMSIDFGVAPIKLPNGDVAGIIDVPGHEDFIHNMLAGASAIDILMLIVAADDSVMPQTIEHLRMSRALGIKEVLVVVTKCDLVTEELTAVVEEDVRGLSDRFGFPNIDIYRISNLTGEGISKVSEKLSELALKVLQNKDQRGFRLYVRDVFSVKGHGTVITGVPSSGEAKPGDALELNAGKTLLNVRGVQSYRTTAESARAHVSSAINLRDINVEDLHRGMSLTERGLYEAGHSILVSIKNEASEFLIKKRMQFTFHAWTIYAGVEVRLLGTDALKENETCAALITFSTPRVLSYGDKFVLRFGGRTEMVASGVVISPSVGRVSRKSRSAFLERVKLALDAAKKNDLEKAALIGSRYEILTFDRARKLFSLHDTELQTLLQRFEKEDEIIPLGKSNWLVCSKKQDVIDRISRAAESANNKSRTALGIKFTQIGKMLGLTEDVVSLLVGILKKDSNIVAEHGYVTLKHLAPRMSPREAQLREAVLKRIRDAGAAGYAKNTLITELLMNPEESKNVLKLLEQESIIITLGEHLILAETVNSIRDKLLKLFDKLEIVTLAVFREATGTTRNSAVALLEHFDARGLTKRKGDGRVKIAKRF